MKGKIDNSKCLISSTINCLYSFPKSLQFWGIKNKKLEILRISQNSSPSSSSLKKQPNKVNWIIFPLPLLLFNPNRVLGFSYQWIFFGFLGGIDKLEERGSLWFLLIAMFAQYYVINWKNEPSDLFQKIIFSRLNYD